MSSLAQSDGRRSKSERRLTALGTGNWNNRGTDNHIKRPAGVSSAGLKQMGMKRIDGIPHPVGCGNTSEGLDASLKYPKQCLVNNEHVYDAGLVRHSPIMDMDPHDHKHPPAGIEASKTVQYNNYQALSNKERDGPDGGKAPSWLLGQQTKRRVNSGYCNNGDPIKHEHVAPHKVAGRPIRRIGPSGHEGPVYDNGAARLNWNVQNQQLNTGPVKHEDMKGGDWKAIGQRLHVSPLGELRYNVGGREDLRPACTHEYTKADKPVSRLTQYENDKQLPRFDRQLDPIGLGGNPTLAQSPDMLAAMYGYDTTPAASSCLQSQSGAGGYGPSPQEGTFAPSEYSCDPARELRPAQVQPVQTPTDVRQSPRGARPDSRASPSVTSFDSWQQGKVNRRASDGGRTPMSARGSDRGQRSCYSQSIASSYYYESEGGGLYGRKEGSRRSKSADRLTQGSRSRASDAPSQQSGFYSDPTRTVTERALNEALKGSRSQRKVQSPDRRSPEGRRPQTARY